MATRIRNGRVQVDGTNVSFVESRYTSANFVRPPKILVMHFTYGGTAASSAAWFNSPDNPGSSAQVVIERDGSIIQCVSFDRPAWHAGTSEWRDRHGNHIVGLNRSSFGIELANWGFLKRAGSGWQSYTGRPIADPFMGVHRNGNPDGSTQPIGWEDYPEAQIRSAVALARAAVDAYGIDEIVGHDDIAPTRKWDPGPAFDMARFRELVFGDAGNADDSTATGELTVNVAEGLNLRAGPGTQFAVMVLLANGTRLRPLERQGRWISVSVLQNGQPVNTGWVHEAYVA